MLAQDRVNRARAYAQRLHFCRVKDDADFAVDAAIAADRGHAFDSEQAACNAIVHEPTELLQRHVAGFNREIGDWVAGGGDLENLRLQYAVGQVAADLVDGVFDFADGGIDVVANFEFGADRRVAFA